MLQTALSFQPGRSGLSRAHPRDVDAATTAAKAPSAPHDQLGNVLCIPFPHPSPCSLFHHPFLCLYMHLGHL